MFGVEPSTSASRAALKIYSEILSAVRGNVLVDSAVKRAGEIVFVQDNAIDLSHYENIYVCGAGKASVPMATAVSKLLGEKLAGGLVITTSAPQTKLERIDIVSGAHPVPDESSLAAGEAMLEFAEKTTEKDLVIFCLSGGASALMEALIPGISLEDLRTTTEVILKSGAAIDTLNAVRIRLSRIKGGGLANAFKAHVIVLVISDVIGNNLSVIGSGPFLAPKVRDHRGHAVAFGFEDRLPPLVRAALTEPLNRQVPVIPHYVIGSAAMVLPIASDSARRLGLQPFAYADPMKGEARAMAAKIMRLAKAKRARGENNFCMIFVGETTVKVRGDGLGGRCQEMATRAADEVAGEPNIAFLAAGTDGIDGPTDAAGGVVVPASAREAKHAGFAIRSVLQRNDSYHFLAAAGSLIRTGPTGTNVNDVCLVVHKED